MRFINGSGLLHDPVSGGPFRKIPANPSFLRISDFLFPVFVQAEPDSVRK